MHRILRLVLALTLVPLLLIGLAGTASAHDPIFISDDQVTPDVGPYMPDGTISWALYGQVLDAGDTRGFEFDLRDGDEFYISLLIPNLAPEIDLADADLPILDVTAPDGSSFQLAPSIREVFDEPFSKTSYVTLLEHREPSPGGRYAVSVIGNAPSRFSVAVGVEEIFFTETERSGDRPSSFLDITEPLQVWYSTPPGGEPTGDASGVAIDTDMLAESMESGEARLADDTSADQALGTEAAAADEDDGTTAAATEVEPTAEPEAVPESTLEPADEPVEAAEETASAVSESTSQDDGGSNTWVAPVVIGAIAVVGGGFFLARRRPGAA